MYILIKRELENVYIYYVYCVNQIPDTACYIPNFITEEEERQVIKYINSVPQPKWTQLSHRRLQNWGGIPHPKGMIAEEIPSVGSKNVKCPNILKMEKLQIFVLYL